MIGIYKITNKLNGKSYIGQATNIERRFIQHRECLINSNKSWYPLARKESNNVEDFSFEILEECKSIELDELEDYYIRQYDSYNNGYNKTSDGQGIAINKNNGIQLIIQYSSYRNNFPASLLTILKKLSQIKGITYTDKILIILFLTQINSSEPFFFTESWITQNTGICHDTYMDIRKRLSNLNILICEDKASIILSIDNLLNNN